MYDPFAYIDAEDSGYPAADEEMFMIPVGNKMFGIDEGLFMGLLIGFVLAQFMRV